MKLYEWASVAIQFVGALILLAYTIYTARQVRALLASNATNREAFVLSRRAWLTIQIRGTPADYTAGSMVYVDVANVGQVPATNVKMGFELKAQPRDQLEALPASLDLGRGAPLGVSGKAWYTVPTDELFGQYDPRTSGVWEELTRGRARNVVMRVLFRIEYDDGFGETRITQYAWFLTGQNLTVWQYIHGSAIIT